MSVGLVASALSQISPSYSRKRWASSVPEENGYSPALGVTSPPMSKRVRYGVLWLLTWETSGVTS